MFPLQRFQAMDIEFIESYKDSALTSSTYPVYVVVVVDVVVVSRLKSMSLSFRISS